MNRDHRFRCRKIARLEDFFDLLPGHTPACPLEGGDDLLHEGVVRIDRLDGLLSPGDLALELFDRGLLLKPDDLLAG